MRAISGLHPPALRQNNPGAASNIAIIGGGAAAVALVSGLSRSVKGAPGESIDVYDRDGSLGPGRAYQTPSPAHLMNTPYRHCSIVPGEAGHLEKWLADSGHPWPVYLSRSDYGNYLRSAGEEAARRLMNRQCRLHVHHADIIDIDRKVDGDCPCYLLRADDGREFLAGQVILALGDPAPAPVPVVEGVTYFPSTWPFENLRDIAPGASIDIAGAGASAIDCCLYLAEDLHHEGPIQVWSRSGRLPCVQRDPARPNMQIPHPALDALVGSGEGVLLLSQIKDAIDSDLVAMFGAVQERRAEVSPQDVVPDFRAQIAAAETGTPSPQDYVRSLRDLAPVLWKRLSPGDQRVFDEQYASLWNRYRHPIALDVARPFLRLLEAGKVTLMRGAPTGQEACQQVLINATGQDFAVTRSASPLIHRILQRGLASPHPRGGLVVDKALRVHGPDGATDGLYALGALTRGTHFAVASIHALVGASEVLCAQLAHDATTNLVDSFQ